MHQISFPTENYTTGCKNKQIVLAKNTPLSRGKVSVRDESVEGEATLEALIPRRFEAKVDTQSLSPGKWADLSPEGWAKYYLSLINNPIYKEKRKALWKQAVKQGRHPLNYEKEATPLEAIHSLWDLEQARKRQAWMCRLRIFWAEEERKWNLSKPQPPEDANRELARLYLQIKELKDYIRWLEGKNLEAGEGELLLEAKEVLKEMEKRFHHLIKEAKSQLPERR